MSRRTMLFAVVAAFMLSSPAYTQSLGDLAKKTQADREKAAAEREKAAKDSKDAPAADSKDTKDAKDAKPDAAPKKTYSDKDLKALESSVPGGLSSTDTASADSAASKDTPKKDEPGSVASATIDAAKHDEAYWRARWTPVAARIAAEYDDLVTHRRRILDLTVELTGIGPLNARRAGVEAERQRLITEAENIENKIAGDKAELASIQEEGRHAGALPGWFR